MLASRKTVYTVASMLLFSVLAIAQKPNFMPAIYADGQMWGTKGLNTLPAPNEHNQQSFDQLYRFTGDFVGAGQLPVAEAAPRNPSYNGGRWSAHFVYWTQMAIDSYGEDDLPVLKSNQEIQDNLNNGNLALMPGADYFECPLLPVK